MASTSKKEWDFVCPQYVDFRAGLDSNAEDIFFDCTDNFSPDVEKALRNVPAPANITEEDENKLIDKMTAALSFLGNTPKIKKNTFKGKLFSEQVPTKHIGVVHPFKPIAKSATVPTRPSVRRRSKSTCDLNKIHTNKHIKTKEFRPKRSSSLDDLKVMKKHTYPKTPLCLKRTMNAKHKVLKTTEEMELEQIAVLQKQLTQLLRNNEISYNKMMKRRQKPCIPKPDPENKPELLKENASINTDKNMRQNVHTMSRTAMRQTTMKLDGIINSKESSHKSPRNMYRNVLEKSKNPSVSSSIISEDFNRSRDQVPKKRGNVNYGFHSGLLFKESIKRPTLKSFNFETKVKEMKAQNTHTNQKTKVSLARSVSNDDVFQGKENIPVTKPKSVVKKVTHIQKIKIDADLLAANKKKIGQRKGNPVRGFTLSENIFRN